MQLNACYTLDGKTYYPKIDIDKDWEDIRPRDVKEKLPYGAFLVGYCPSEYANKTFKEIEEMNNVRKKRPNKNSRRIY